MCPLVQARIGHSRIRKSKANLNMHEPNHKIIIVRKTIQSLLKKKKTATLSNQNPNPAKATSTRVF